MKVSSILKFNHEMIDRYGHKHAVFIDATCGNGNDTYYMAKKFNRSTIYAFDIQEEAIINSKEKCYEFNNIQYINDSHSKFDDYDLKSPDLIVYNLGYLPGSEADLSTYGESTIESIDSGLKILKEKGAILLTIYTSHDNHTEEKILLNYIYTLSKYEYNIVKYQFMLLDNSPYSIVIEKK